MTSRAAPCGYGQASPGGWSESEARELLRRGERELLENGDLGAARRWFEQACLVAEWHGDGNALAAGALGLGGLWVHEHREADAWARVTSWQRRALARQDVHPQLAARLRARLAAEQDYRTGQSARILNMLAEARVQDDPVTLTTTLSLAHHCLLGPENGTLRAALAEELLQAAATTGRRFDRLMGLLWQTVDRFLDGDPHAERSLGRLRAALGERDHLALGYAVQGMDVMLAIRAGRFERAETMAADCLRSGELCGDHDAEGWYRGQLLTIRWLQGRSPEVLPLLQRELHASMLSELDDSLVAALAVAAAGGGEDSVAAGALARLGRGDLRGVPSSSIWLATNFGAVEAAAMLGDVDTAACAYSLLEPYARLPTMTSLAMACFGTVDQALGVASMTVGEPDRAVEHLRRAVRGNLALGHRPAHCLSRHRLAEALTQRGGAGDDAAAENERAWAKREADRLGMALPAHRRPTGPHVSTVTTGRAISAPRASRTPTTSVAEVFRESASDCPVTDVQVRLLGPVDVKVGNTVRVVPGVRRQTVLAVLALQAGEVVSTMRLIDIVWEGSAPRTPANTIQSHVSFLRRVIDAGSVIRSRSGGYLLDLGAEATDVAAAERLVQQGTQAADPAEAIERLQEALALWRGRPMLGLGGSAWVGDQSRRLNQLFLTAHRALAQARLQFGQHEQLVAELEPLTWDHPLHEQIYEPLMLALYRDNQQSRAIEVYGRLRSALREELGIDPSPPLQGLYEAILRQDEGRLGPVRYRDVDRATS